MSVRVCPIAVVQAPADRVWALLSEPASYARWWEAQTLAIVPAGPAQHGQQISAQSRALGRQWPVSITVEAVDSARRAIDLTTRLPFGITVHSHIVVSPLAVEASRVSFG